MNNYISIGTDMTACAIRATSKRTAICAVTWTSVAKTRACAAAADAVTRPAPTNASANGGIPPPQGATVSMLTSARIAQFVRLEFFFGHNLT